MTNQNHIVPAILTAACCLMSWLVVVPDAAGQVFENRTYDAGLDAMWQGHGVGTADYDGDGDQDLYIAARWKHDPFNPRSWNRLFRNNGDGTFEDVTASAGAQVDFLPDLPAKVFGNKFSVAWADYDRDGDPDLLLTHVGPEVLFRNNGDGTFTDVATDAGLNPADGTTDDFETAGATWFDFDLDGYLDLYLSSWNGPNRFYRNNGDGTFEDISESTGMDLEDRTWMSMSWDVNRDGWPDLYLANDFGPNTLFINLKNGQFADRTSEWGLGDPGESMGLALGDASGDGFPDLYVTNNAVRGGDMLLNTFFLGAAVGPLIDTAQAEGIANTDWAWGTEMFDGDLDGDLDLFVVNGALIERGTPNRYFKNRKADIGVFRFEDASASSQADGRAESHGLLVFDVENDGDPDLLITNWDEPLYLLTHPGTTNTWLKVGLQGSSANLEGFGSEITLFTAKGEQKRFHNGVDFLGQNIQPAMFGLGSLTSYDAIEVIWPGGMTERWEGGPASTLRTLVQGTGTLIATNTEELSLPESSTAVYPNPARDHVSFILESVPADSPSEWIPASTDWAQTWTVYDALGRRMASGQAGFGRQEIRLDTSSWAAGLYLLKVSVAGSWSDESRPFVVLGY